MKRLFTSLATAILFLLVLACPVWAATYYVDSTSTGGNGTTTATSGANAAFQTIAAAMAALTGDQHDNSLLLKCGQKWRETAILAASGTSGHPFTIGSYGSGYRPILNNNKIVPYVAGEGASYNPGIPGTSAPIDLDFRTAIPANWISYDGTQVRVLVHGSAVYLTTITGAFIGEKASSGDAYDMKPGTITQITFGGNNTYALAAGEDKYSDWTTYSFDHTKDYIISIGSTGGFQALSSDDGHSNYYSVTASNAGIADVSGYSATNGRLVLSKFEIPSASNVWSTTGNNVWYTYIGAEPSRIFFDFTQGNKKNTLVSVTSNYDYYWSSNILYVYCVGNPNSNYINPGIGYPSPDAFAGTFSITTQNYINVNNINLLGPIGHGFSVVSSNYVTISNSNIAGANSAAIASQIDGVYYWGSIGGVLTNVNVSYCLNDGISGNGTGDLSCWYCTSHHNGRVDINTSGDGFTSHGSNRFSAYYCVGYGNTKSGIAVTGSGGGNIWNGTFYNNFDATDQEGTGWLSNLGIGVGADTGGTWNLRNNITFGHQYEVFVYGTFGINSDYNCFYDSRKNDYGSKCFCWNNVNMTWAEFKAASGGDSHSLNADPKMVSPPTFDFRLQSISSCISTGINVGLTELIPDMGAYGYFPHRKLIGGARQRLVGGVNSGRIGGVRQ